MRKHKTLGQTMTEYIIIVALCAIGLLLVVTFFGNDIRQIFFTASSSLRQGKAADVKWDAEYKKGDKKHSSKKLSGEAGGGGGAAGK